jgi:uncharacterized protein (TIGR02145 family)
LSAKTDWKASKFPEAIGYNLSQNNRSGFRALPAGGRENDGVFSSIGGFAGWWSATEDTSFKAYARSLLFLSGNFFSATGPKNCGYSVRLIKD